MSSNQSKTDLRLLTGIAMVVVSGTGTGRAIIIVAKRPGSAGDVTRLLLVRK